MTTFARTVALTGLLVLTISMDLGLGPKPISQPPEVLLYQFETAFFVLTFLALLFTYLLPPRRLVAVAWGSMAIDLALACVLVAMTDRTQSVFIFAMPLAVLSAAALLERKGAFFAASVATLVLGAFAMMDLQLIDVDVSTWRTAWLHALGQRRPPTAQEVTIALAVQIGALYATALLASKLVIELSRARDRALVERRDLTALRQRFEDVFASMPDGVMTVSTDGVVRSANPALAAILSTPREALVNARIETVFPELQQLDSSTSDTQEIARGEEPIEEVWRAATDGKRQTLAVRVETLRGLVHELSGPVETLYVVRDITALRAREREHRNRERLASVGAMAMAVAHEIRNPLASISGSIQMLNAQGQVDELGASLMAIVVRETEQLSAWIGEFLEFARPSEPSFEVLDFAALLGEKVEAWRNAPNIRAAELTIEVVLPEVPTRLLGDAHSLSSVIWNLLVNAQQAACESDHQVVRVVLVAGDQAHILVVEDSGSGIAPRDYEHLFEPFFTTRSHGTGIGLATVRRGVDTHRGRIVVGKSELGGARFEVRLPRDLRRHVEPLLRQSLAATPVALD